MLAMRSFLAGNVPPVVQSNFALSANDFDSLSSTSSMPTGGSISRAGNATLYDSTGKLTYAPNNLLLWSQDFQTTAEAGSSRPWVIGNGTSTLATNAGAAPDNTNTASLMAFSASAYPARYQQINAVGGVTYIFSVWMKLVSGSGANARVEFYSPGGFIPGVATNTTIDGSWKRIAVSATATGSGAIQVFIDPNYVASATGSVLIWGAQLEAVTYQTTPSTYVATTTSAYYGPRFDYDPVTLAAKGLLVEGTRTNLLTYSEQFDNAAWGQSNATVSANATTSPSGTATADKLVASATSSGHWLYSALGTTSGSNTWSVYAKAGEYTWLGINAYVGGNNLTSFNLSTGVVGTNAAGNTATITPVGNGWYRCSVTRTGGAATYIELRVANADNSFTFTGDGTSGLYLFGAQFEIGAFASSYIPTVASSVARAAETFSLTGYANRLVEAFYIDEETGANYSGNSALSTGTVTISPPTFGWVTSLRAYQNAYAGSISSPSWLSFSRAGNAMYYDSTGTLTWAPANLIPQSQDFATTWTRGNVSSPTVFISAPDNSNTGAKLAASNTSLVVHQVYNIGVALSAGTYIASVYLKKDAYSYGIVNFYDGVDNYCYFNLDNGVPGTAAAGVTTGMQSVGNGWYRCWARKTISAVTGGMSIEFSNADNTPASSAAIGSGVYAWGAQLEPVTYQTAPSAYIPTTSAAVYGPRYDYDPSTVPATPRGLLIEEQRVNIVTWSQQFEDGVWQNASPEVPTVSANTSDTLAPDGTGTADKVTASTGGTASHLRQEISGAFSGAYTISFYIKNGNSAQSRVRLFDAGFNTVASALVNWSGSLISSLSSVTGTASYSSVGNGWYRVVIATSSLGSNSFLYPSFYPDSSAGTGFVYLWGAQLEAGSFATSYIPTTTASVTRAADVAQLTGSALTTLQGSSVTAISEAVSSVSTNRYLINARKIASGNYGDYISLGSLASQIYAGSVVQANLTYSPAPTTTSIFRAAFAIQANNFAAVANNGTVQTDGTGSIVTGIDQGWLGGYSDGVYLNGYVRSMALYNQRLPDAILKQKSVVNAPY